MCRPGRRNVRKYRNLIMDTFNEVSRQSWFSRLGDAVKGIVFGVVLVGLSLAVLFWNEGRAVKRHGA